MGHRRGLGMFGGALLIDEFSDPRAERTVGDQSELAGVRMSRERMSENGDLMYEFGDMPTFDFRAIRLIDEEVMLSARADAATLKLQKMATKLLLPSDAPTDEIVSVYLPLNIFVTSSFFYISIFFVRD